MSDDNDYRGQKDILAAFPKLPASALKSWARCTPPLVKTRDHPKNPRYQLYCFDDVKSIVDEIRDDLPDEFDGWRWMQLLKGEKGKREFHIPTLYVWSSKGCPAIGGRKFCIKRFRSWSDLKGRDYCRVDELAAVTAFNPPDGAVGLPPGFTPRASLEKTEANPNGLFHRDFLTKFSDSPTKTRRDRHKTRPHSALLGADGKPRPIQAAVYQIIKNGKRLPAVAYRDTDWKAVLAFTVPADIWRNREQIIKHHELLTDSELQYAEEHGRLNPEKFSTPPTHGKPSEIKYWRITELKELEQYIRTRNALPRPVTGPQAMHNRVEIDGDGDKWYPLRESLILAGVTTAKEKIHFDTYVVAGYVRSKQASGRLFRSKHDGYSLFHFGDLNNIYRGKNGTDHGRQRIPTGSKKGRPKKYDPQTVHAERQAFINSGLTTIKEYAEMPETISRLGEPANKLKISIHRMLVKWFNAAVYRNNL